MYFKLAESHGSKNMLPWKKNFCVNFCNIIQNSAAAGFPLSKVGKKKKLPMGQHSVTEGKHN